MRPEQVRRSIALIVDDLGLSFESTHFVRNALRKFVDEQMQSGDMVAIIRTGAGVGALQQFTTDKRLLHAAIDRLKWNAFGRRGIAAFGDIGDDAYYTEPRDRKRGTFTSTGSDEPTNVDDFREIKKRAIRLKSSLALPQEQNEEKSAGFKDAEKAELQPALAALNKLLDGFLRNPIFSDSGPLDMRLAARARRDLEDIIVLSEKLRKNAEKRSKSTDRVP